MSQIQYCLPAKPAPKYEAIKNLLIFHLSAPNPLKKQESPEMMEKNQLFRSGIT
jgi:hypothetical protein